MVTVVASVAVGLVILLNLTATWMLARSDFETPLKKGLQLVLAWTVPVIGSIIVIAVLRSTGSGKSRSGGSEGSGDFWQPGIGPVSDTSEGHHGGFGEGGGHGGDAGSGGH